MTAEEFTIILIVMMIGSIIQGAVGFGANLVAAPILVLIDPSLVPGPILVAGMALHVLMIAREREHGGLQSVAWALGGRVPGTIAAVVALAMLPADRIGIVFATLILLGCALSLGGLRLTRTPPTLVGAGVLSGFMGTTIGVGGPPLALVYQGDTGPVIRGALARYFAIGGGMSIAMLLVAGQFTPAAFAASLLLIPGVVLGFLVSTRLGRFLDQGRTRAAVLAVSAGSALFVLARELV